MDTKPDLTYGQVTSCRDAEAWREDMMPPMASQATEDGISASGNALYSYKHEHKIDGIIVAEADRSLPIDRVDLLAAAFTLERKPASLVCWVDPADKTTVDVYNALLDKVYQGTAFILEEQKHFDAQQGKFALWVRYDNVQYKLHPRFEYLREDVNNV